MSRPVDIPHSLPFSRPSSPVPEPKTLTIETDWVPYNINEIVPFITPAQILTLKQTKQVTIQCDDAVQLNIVVRKLKSLGIRVLVTEQALPIRRNSSCV